MHFSIEIHNEHQARLMAQMLGNWFEGAQVGVAGNSDQPQPVALSTAGDAASESAGEATAAVTAAPAAAAKRGRKAKSESAPAGADEPAAGEPEKESPAFPSLDDARNALQEYSAKHDMARAIDLLKSFGAQRVSELSEGSRQAFIDACAA